MLLEVDAINTYPRARAHPARRVARRSATARSSRLVGRNGAGRTTIIESIMGLLPVRSGAIRFRGEDITAPAAAQARQARHRLRARELPASFPS